MPRTGHIMVDKMKLTLLFVVLIVTVSCSTFSQPTNESMDNTIGWMHGNCLAIKNPNIPSGYDFKLVHLGDEQTTENAIILQKAIGGEKCYPLLDDRVEINTQAGYSFYLVKSKNPVNLAIGFLESEINLNLNFDFCNTIEGIQFSISKKDSSLIWEGYYYLGYESEPTCENY